MKKKSRNTELDQYTLHENERVIEEVKLQPSVRAEAVYTHVINDLYNSIDAILALVPENSQLEHSVLAQKNNLGQLRFDHKPLNEYIRKFIITKAESSSYFNEWGELVPDDAYSKTKLRAIQLGILIGVLTSRRQNDGSDKIPRREGEKIDDIFPGLIQALPEVVGRAFSTALAELENGIKRHQATMGGLSKTQEYSIDVASYLKGKNPKVSIKANNLHLLPESIKEVGRQYLRVTHGNEEGIDSLIKEVFRSPRKSKARGNSDIYHISGDSDFEGE